MKKGLIFGGIALVMGVGAYLWYKNTLKKIKEETTPDKAPDNSATVYDKQGVVIQATQQTLDQLSGKESHNYGSRGITSTSFGNQTKYGA